MKKRNEYHIAAAGSLLGVKLNQGFPVGKVDFLDLAPLSFFEFLTALSEQPLRDLIEQMQEPIAISKPLHERLITLLKTYFAVGGMPQAVSRYIKTKSFNEVRRVQTAILDAYILDFANHAPKNELMRIMAVWEQIPYQLSKENKKFVFSAISKSARAREYETAMQWMIGAGVIIKCNNINNPKLPLKSYTNTNIFKIYCLDIGLLGAMSNLDPAILVQKNKLFEEFKEALVENYAIQELKLNFGSDVFYWTSKGNAEVDFLVSYQQYIYPFEVKAGYSKQKKSLMVYGNKYMNDEYRTQVLSRSTLRNFIHNGDIVNYPLYAITLFPRLGVKKYKAD